MLELLTSATLNQPPVRVTDHSSDGASSELFILVYRGRLLAGLELQ